MVLPQTVIPSPSILSIWNLLNSDLHLEPPQLTASHASTLTIRWLSRSLKFMNPATLPLTLTPLMTFLPFIPTLNSMPGFAWQNSMLVKSIIVYILSPELNIVGAKHIILSSELTFSSILVTFRAHPGYMFPYDYFICFFLNTASPEFPSGLVVRIPHFHHVGTGLIHGLETKILHATVRPKKKKKYTASPILVCVCVCVWVAQLCLWDPMDCSPPGSSILLLANSLIHIWLR